MFGYIQNTTQFVQTPAQTLSAFDQRVLDHINNFNTKLVKMAATQKVQSLTDDTTAHAVNVVA